MKGLATQRASELDPRAAGHRWLIEDLWADQAVGIIGGEPKSCKSFLALDLAVAVASGSPCLRRHAVTQSGPVLLFAGEDALHIVRRRLEGIAHCAGFAFEHLEIHVITEPTLRIDLEDHRQRLLQSVAQLQPRLLILDPFVRIHRADENLAAEVAPLLAYLREIQRRFATAVVLVHHSRKAGHARAGQALRGSSELHAWGDSNLYLRRKGDHVLLSVEHRAAPSPPTRALELHAQGEGISLRVVDTPPEPIDLSPPDRILQALANTSKPMSRRALRDTCRIRASTVGEILGRLVTQGSVVEDPDGYRLPAG